MSGAAREPHPLGSCVLISGLKTKPQHNGQYGVVEDSREAQGNGRLTVRLEAGGDSLRLKPANLEKVCSGCKGAGLKLSACSRCKSAFFCGKDCIKAAWPAHKKECGKQRWLVDAQKKSAALEQEIAAAKRTFDRAAESEPALIQRVMDCSKKINALSSSRNHAGVISARQEALWAFAHMREFYKRGLEGDRSFSNGSTLAGLAHDACGFWQRLGEAYIRLGQFDKAGHAFETQLAFCEERNLHNQVSQEQ
jgi:tetratricopeptide (TPR) repeat protein